MNAGTDFPSEIAKSRPFQLAGVGRHSREVLRATVGAASTNLARDAEKWNPVFLNTHAIPENPAHDDVSIKRHHALAENRRYKSP